MPLILPRDVYRDGGFNVGFFKHGVGAELSSVAPVVALNSVLGVVGDSMTYASLYGNTYMCWLTLAMSGRCKIRPTTGIGTSAAVGSMLGVSGESTAQIAARSSNIGASNLGVAFCMGFENDGTGVTAEQMQANWSTVFSALSSASRVYIIGTGETKTVYASSSLQARNAAFNAWAAGASGSFPHVRFIPSNVAWNGIMLHNGAGGAGADSYDGIHPNIQGAMKFAQNIWNYVQSDFVSGDAYSANTYTNQLYPADFTGTGGSKTSATGDVADGLAVANTTGATVVCSKGTLHGKPSQIITISGTATAASNVRLRESCSNTYVTNDSIMAIGRIKVTAADGVSRPVGMKGFGFDIAGKHYYLNQYHPLTSGDWLLPFDGTFRNRPEFMSSGSTFFYADTTCQLQTGTPIDVRIEVADLKVYNMTQEGA